MLEIKHKDSETRGEFLAFFDGKKAGLMTYSWIGKDQFIIDHTQVEEAYNGKGFGKAMVYKAVEFAREKNIKIIPLCPFAKAMFDKNEEIRDVL